MFIHKTICCIWRNLSFLCSVIFQGKVVALDRWGGKWNHLSMTHGLTTNCAKNYCNRTLIVKVIVENAVTCFYWDTVYIRYTPHRCSQHSQNLSTIDCRIMYPVPVLATFQLLTVFLENFHEVLQSASDVQLLPFPWATRQLILLQHAFHINNVYHIKLGDLPITVSLLTLATHTVQLKAQYSTVKCTFSLA